MADTYSLDEKVLCYSGPELFLAKVIEVDQSRDKPYLIHYNQWNKKWDEWTDASQLKKYTVSNMELKKKLSKEKAKQEAKNKKRPRETGSGRNSPALGKTATSNKKLKLTVDIPKGLKEQLIFQEQSIFKDHKLLVLPTETCVDDVLGDYIKNCRNADEDTKTVVEGLKTYFNKSLEAFLLYNFEKPQCKSVKKEQTGKEFSQVYGPEHFLRLFVRLPEFLEHSTWNQTTSRTVQQKLSEILTFIQKKRSQYFKEEQYHDPGHDYIQSVQDL
mmetsp:Transcript_17815/g.34803  ORF Transcript_17815/g.34803 Transcript_17815/m.34803 type:complete len:272 (+) Transcript_17815:24-839(+)